MPRIDDPVGAGARNSIHDVALIRAMLTLIRNKAGVPYYQGDYQFDKDPTAVRLTIEAFQVENGLVPAKLGPPTGSEQRGVVRHGGATWNLMVERLPPAWRGMRTLEGVPVAYLPMPRAKLDKNINLFHMGSKNLWGSLADSVLRLFRDFYDKSQISLVLMNSGGWRSFDDQLDMNSDSGPGETIHNYGYAVDLGFDGLEYLDRSGAKFSAGRGLEELGPVNKKNFFLARNNVARGLYETIKGGDFYHLQAFDDDTLDSVGSFMALLEAHGPKKMKWAPRLRTPTDYLCDLGLGGDKYYVGTATDIWELNTTYRISKDDLARALNSRRKREPGFQPGVFLGSGNFPADGEISAEQVSAAHLAAVQTMLRGEFLAAEARWARWQPVKYPGADRRAQNPRKIDKKRKRPPRPPHRVHR
jgi:hypothetical protein